MVHFVVAGKPDCRNLVQVMNVLSYLKKTLPSFEYKVHDLTFDQWEEYLTSTNKLYDWHHSESPLIYKENYCYGCKNPVYIGGMSEFWEYCYDYYGINCILDPETISNLVAENLTRLKISMLDTLAESLYTLYVLVYGATNDILTLLVPRILSLESLKTKFQNVRFILYDENLDSFSEDYFSDFNDDLRDMFGVKAVYCDNLGEGLKDANLMLIINDTTGFNTDENRSATLNYLVQLNFLAEEINLCAREDLRIIFASDGLPCHFATILTRKILIPQSQIVVVSSHLGLGYLGEMSRKLNISVSKMGAPPIWGSVGYNDFADPGSVLIKCQIRKPNKRATRATLNSTLTHGVTHCELRFINYLSDEIPDLNQQVAMRREVVRNNFHREPSFPKVEAIVNLIEIWYNCTPMKEPIMSLGIMSDGSFNIPHRIVFSQPAIQHLNGWIPYGKYPVSNHILQKVLITSNEAEELYEKYTELDLKPIEQKASVIRPRESKYKSMKLLQQELETALI